MSTAGDGTRVPGQQDPTPGRREPLQFAQGDASKPKMATGIRPLTALEQAQRQRALACAAPSKEEATAGCSQLLDFTVFFDGTGNNRSQEMTKPANRRALSNVAKLFDAHQTQELPGRVVLYIPGVGTPFPTIGDSGGMWGMMLGQGSDQRIAYALEQLDRAIAAVPPAVKLRLVTINAFGFSRGAAAARAFVRDVAQRCTLADGTHRYRGVLLRIAFLGLFDTVCSAYDNTAQAAVSLNGGHNGWADDMRIPAMVEQSVHMTAGHEARIRFPLDSVRDGHGYPDNAHEICYPGVHSDVGGGYAPNEQGAYNTVSRFALNEMLTTAKTGGVRLQAIASLRPEIRQEYELDGQLSEAFNAYNRALGKSRGTLEQLQAAHMELLHRWLKQRVEASPATQRRKRLAARAAELHRERAELHESAAAFNRKYRSKFMAPAAERKRHEAELARLRAGYEEQRRISDEVTDLDQENAKALEDIEALRTRRDRGRELTFSEDTMLRAWDNPSPLPEDVSRFFDLYTHDSVAHFDFDRSRLTDWRTIYFGEAKYSPT